MEYDVDEFALVPHFRVWYWERPGEDGVLADGVQVLDFNCADWLRQQGWDGTQGDLDIREPALWARLQDEPLPLPFDCLLSPSTTEELTNKGVDVQQNFQPRKWLHDVYDAWCRDRLAN